MTQRQGRSIHAHARPALIAWSGALAGPLSCLQLLPVLRSELQAVENVNNIARQRFHSAQRVVPQEVHYMSLTARIASHPQIPIVRVSLRISRITSVFSHWLKICGMSADTACISAAIMHG